jgi:hypothetical protein
MNEVGVGNETRQTSNKMAKVESKQEAVNQ